MHFIFINPRKKTIDVIQPVGGNVVLTAVALLSRRHEGMVFTPVYLAASDHDYEVYSGGDFVAEEVKRLAVGVPAEKDDKGKVTKEAVPGDIDAAIAFTRKAGSLVAKLNVSPPKIDG